MLGNDGDEPFQTPQDRTMDHDGSSSSLVCGAVLQVEPFRQLEVELDSSTLERSAKSVPNRDVDLGTIERAIARVELPLTGIVGFECFFELLQKNHMSLSDTVGTG